METCTPVLPNGRVGTFVGAETGVAAGALDWAKDWPAATSRADTRDAEGFDEVPAGNVVFFHSCFMFGLSPRHERVPFVSRFVFCTDADGPQTAYGTFVFANAAADAQRGIHAGLLQAHFNEDPVAG